MQIALQEADGFLTDSGRGTPAYVAWMRQTALQAGRDAFKRGLYLSLHVTAEPHVARERLLRSVAWALATTPYEPVFYDQVGVERELIDQVRQQMGMDEMIAQNRDPRQAIPATALTRAAHIIPDAVAARLIAAHAVIGTVEECAAQLGECAWQGVDFVVLDGASPFADTVLTLDNVLQTASLSSSGMGDLPA